MKEAEIIEAIQGSKRVSIGGGQTRGGGDFAPAQSGVVSYSPDELLITVKTGTPMDELNAILADKEQILAQDPMDYRAILGTNGLPTIGGAIGVNADGPRRMRYGSLREATLGLKFIDGQGEVVRAGGVVMKNVTGLDITKLFVGSKGRLGVALEANFKLLPMPRESITSRFTLAPEDFAQRVLPVLREPLEITSCVYVDGSAYLRQEGELLKPLLQTLEDRLGVAEPEADTIWQDLRDWQYLAAEAEIWRIFLRPSEAIATAQAVGAPYMVLSGGTQLAVAASEAQISPKLRVGQFAICEKGTARGKRIPRFDQGQDKLRDQLCAVFDPSGKFGATNAH